MVQNQVEKQLQRCKTKSTDYSSKGLDNFFLLKKNSGVLRRNFPSQCGAGAKKEKIFMRSLWFSMERIA